ncbi:MAG: GerMN domain-containing protein, partial [Propionicimonas sp.]|nr:GerMN domain-containing protein [Propionicimonas sp.]
MSRSWRDGVGAALAALVLAGCAGVPTSGPVRQHEPGDQEVSSSVNVAAVPPADGASAMLVVEGFLHAMGTDQPGFAIARQYLTDAASRAWKPEDGTSIYADGYQPKATDASTDDYPVITLETVLTGTLTPSGEYREGSGGLRHDFGLVRTADDQWRISKPPDGLLISRYQFTTNYVARTLHYLDATGSVLVPDPRFFAQNAAALETLVRSQLAGPSDWLAPAVRDGSGAGLVVDRVELTGQGIASVYLTGSAAQLGDDTRRTLMAELTTTLAELTQVSGVQVSVASTLLPLPGTTATTLTADDFEDLAPTDQ